MGTVHLSISMFLFYLSQNIIESYKLFQFSERCSPIQITKVRKNIFGMHHQMCIYLAMDNILNLMKIVKNFDYVFKVYSIDSLNFEFQLTMRVKQMRGN